ncbi:hypothetical protein GCM10029976_044110 [Kribbella albertanoniae]|uniref:DUF3592 domain-containing protein n=1 Tax=Kribbella albertanoniae TaxID=1266829 RepID=A0A4R4PN41_9ACTN|nr:DUF3592 domain-containing protein [Kribbella albertanoniae]TDC23443.1 DUF3592 domain-containing protein [Kribbella albertanoniae]
MTETRTRPRAQWSVGFASVLLVICALVSVMLGWWEVLTLNGLQERGEVVTGTVLKVDDSGKHQSIKVRYTTLAGKTITATTGNFRQAVVGQPIEIRYDREHPGRMTTADWDLDTTFPKYLSGGLAVLFVLGSLAAMRKRQPQVS